jgi:hypothetical protein
LIPSMFQGLLFHQLHLRENCDLERPTPLRLWREGPLQPENVDVGLLVMELLEIWNLKWISCLWRVLLKHPKASHSSPTREKQDLSGVSNNTASHKYNQIPPQPFSSQCCKSSLVMNDWEKMLSKSVQSLNCNIF